MKEMQNVVINTTFSFYMFYMIYLNYTGLLKTKLDYYISLIAIVISVMIIISKNIIILDIGHFLYCVYLFIITFISKNIYLLGLNILMLLVILFTRYYFNTCILNEKQNSKGFFTELNHTISKYVVFWDWYYLYRLLLIISLGRFIKLKWF
jgi:hypothetical protein